MPLDSKRLSELQRLWDGYGVVILDLGDGNGYMCLKRFTCLLDGVGIGEMLDCAETSPARRDGYRFMAAASRFTSLATM